jgi:anti-sigma factor RsiW
MPIAEFACQDVVEAVTDYLDDAVSPDRRDELDRHLAGCDGCTEYVGQIRATVDALGAARPTPVVPDH